jgi:hypothetical protein
MSRGRWFVVGTACVIAIVLFLTADARAFCGFYVSGADGKLFNDATEVVLLRDGTRTVLSMQNHYAGPPEDFAMVVPVPVVLQKDQVKTLPPDVFDRIDKLSSPRLVEYWEQDPCPVGGDFGGMRKSASIAAGPPPEMTIQLLAGVRVEAQFAVGEYEIVILGADDSLALDAWLRSNKYKIPEGAEKYLRPYVAAGSKFFVAKVDTQKVKRDAQQRIVLSPLRFHYDANTFSLPVRLGLLNSGGTQDLVVMILAKDMRYEVANYPNVTIPTNIDVAETARASFGSFYASLFDATVAKHPGAAVTEYAWNTGSCDPCPGPTLGPGDLATLGTDALVERIEKDQKPNVWRPPSFGSYVVTRLHVRYGKDALGEDLVFKEAPPIEGGREDFGRQQQSQDAKPSTFGNQFQARYVIRHPWTGRVECRDPQWGTWGGPPDGRAAKTDAAQNTAFASRNMQFTSFVVGAVESLGTNGTARMPPRAKPALVPTPRGAWGSVTVGALVGLAVVCWLAGRSIRRSKRSRS